MYKRQLLDPQHYPVPYGFNTDAYRAELQAAARGVSLQLGNVARADRPGR